MEKLPRILKPYYTISETFSRLNLAGAHLDEEGDVHLICSEGDIEINLLLAPHQFLMNHLYARPHKLDKSFSFMPSDEDIKFAIENLSYTEDSVHMEFFKINCPTLMIPKWVCGGNLNEEVEKVEAYNTFDLQEDIVKSKAKLYREQLLEQMEESVESSLNSSITTVAPAVITPYKVPEDYRAKSFGDPVKFNLNKEMSINPLFSLCALQLNDCIYYTCDDVDSSYFSEMVQYRVTFKSGKEYWPTHVLRQDLMHKAIRSENFVVTRENIKKYERDYLGVKHEIEIKELPSYLDNNSPYFSRELAIAIEAHTAIFVNGEGNQYKAAGERVKTWVCEHYPKESKSGAFVERISSVVLPKK